MKKLILLICMGVFIFGKITELWAEEINCKTGQQSCGTNCRWLVDGSNLIITGGKDGSIGTMNHYSYKKGREITPPWEIYNDTITSVDISGISNIGKATFNRMIFLEIMNISNDIKNIYSEALEDKSIKYITLPNLLTTIGAENFRSWSELVSIEIPDSVSSIGSLAFSKDENLILVKLPNSLTSTGESLFKESPNLKEIIISDTITSEQVNLWNDKVFSGLAENVVIRCQGEIEKCQTAMQKYIPDDNGTCAVDDCLKGVLFSPASESQCMGANYYWSGSSCKNKKTA